MDWLLENIKLILSISGSVHLVVLATYLWQHLNKDTVKKAETGIDMSGAGHMTLINKLRVENFDAVLTHHEVEIFYATDRNITSSKSPSTFYGNENGELSFGTMRVSIPKIHKPGELEEPSILRLQFKANKNKHFILEKIQQLNSAKWADEINETDSESALLFIHGYKVSFEESAKRMAQLKWDLNYAGPCILYSWPSKSKFRGYDSDIESAKLTTDNLNNVLDIIKNETNLSKVDIIAHSMGCRLITDVISEFSKNENISVEQLILAAPDIYAESFKKQIAPKLMATTKKISLYASSNDKALKASKKKTMGHSRLGESGEDIVIIEGIDTIDASEIDTDFLGHSYFADSKVVIDDIHNVVKNSLPPENRNLRKRSCTKGIYWTFP